ncbi:hypothetical protein WA158_005110 [Blastocystis sp. Blastoise]
MRRFAVRPRPLQPQKKVQVFHLQNPAILVDSNGEQVMMSTYEDEGVDYSTTHPDISRKTISIPTPTIITDPHYDSQEYTRAVQPRAYIKYIPLSHEAEYNQIEYNLDEADEEWLRNNPDFGDNASESSQISLEIFEKMIDVIDKQAGVINDISIDTVERLFVEKLQFHRDDSLTIAEKVHDYWLAKRKKLGKPLLRRYWPVTSITDSNPHLVFRPRERPEKYRFRKHRKYEGEIHEKLNSLLSILENSIGLCNEIKLRENLKFKKIVLLNEIFEQYIYDLDHPDGPERSITISEPLPYQKMFTRLVSLSASLPVTLSTLSLSSLNPSMSSTPFSSSTSTMNKKMTFIRNQNTLSEASIPVSPLVTPETLFYKYSRSLQQANGYYSLEKGLEPHPVPTLAVKTPNTDYSTLGWLTPNESPSAYTSIPAEKYRSSRIDPDTVDLSKIQIRGRIGRGNRIIIDRLPQQKRFFEYPKTTYSSNIPLTPVDLSFKENHISQGNRNLSESTLITPSFYPPSSSSSSLLPISNYVSKRKQYDLNTLIPSLNSSNTIPIHLTDIYTSSQGSEGSVSVDSCQKLLINRNSTSDSLQFVL